jgi:hypothetical protein
VVPGLDLSLTGHQPVCEAASRPGGRQAGARSSASWRAVRSLPRMLNRDQEKRGPWRS